jgi:hypothetical protein
MSNRWSCELRVSRMAASILKFAMILVGAQPERTGWGLRR